LPKGLQRGHFFYPWHFSLLACFSLVLAALTRLHVATGLSVSLALSGALHASALVFTLRTRQVIWRRCLFIAVAAALSAATLHAGILAGQLFESALGASLGSAMPYAALGFLAAPGALAYGLLIRASAMYTVPKTSLAVIAIGCLLATYIAFLTLAHFHFLGRWWLAVCWWYAFSGGLCYFDGSTAPNAPSRIDRPP
jgi:hypothetical protein